MRTAYFLFVFLFLFSCVNESKKLPSTPQEAVAKAQETLETAAQVADLAGVFSEEESQELLNLYQTHLSKYAPTEAMNCSGDPADFFAFGVKTAEDAVLNQFPISEKMEKEYGEEFHQSISKEYKLIDADPRRQKLLTIFNKMLPYRERKNIDYSLHLIDHDMINAFAIIGGHIYFTTGILDFVDSDDELAVIMGHELGHNDKKHTVRKIQKMTIANSVLGDIGVMAANFQIVITAPFGQVDEYESDRVGAFLAHKAGYNPRKGKDFFAKLKKNEKYNLLEKLQRSHPYSAQREQCLEDYISKELKL